VGPKVESGFIKLSILSISKFYIPFLFFFGVIGVFSGFESFAAFQGG
jgi:hypothetical protein